MRTNLKYNMLILLAIIAVFFTSCEVKTGEEALNSAPPGFEDYSNATYRFEEPKIGEKLSPKIIVKQQAVKMDNRIYLEKVVTDEDAWVVLYDGDKNLKLSQANVKKGTHYNVPLTISNNPKIAPKNLYVTMYVDKRPKKKFGKEDVKKLTLTGPFYVKVRVYYLGNRY